MNHSSNAPHLTELARRIQRLSYQYWGRKGTLNLIGNSEVFLQAQNQLMKLAQVESPILLTGESGVGKEVFARSLYLLSKRIGKTFITVNCAQYQDENLAVSELFGHKKGSFTGADKDHIGVFEAADGGVLFLDEVGELSLKTQAMLLRALGEGEIKPLGSNQSKKVNVRVITATNRPLEKMVAEKTFREDLFYRLRYLRIRIPALRERGDDWQQLSQFCLDTLAQKYGEQKRLSDHAHRALSAYSWVGNIRELQGILEMSYCLAEDNIIEPQQFVNELSLEGSFVGEREAEGQVEDHYDMMTREGFSFWETVRAPYLERKLNKEQAAQIVQKGLRDAQGSYKRLLEIFNVESTDYLKFMDFLRHHQLKPDRDQSTLLKRN